MHLRNIVLISALGVASGVRIAANAETFTNVRAYQTSPGLTDAGTVPRNAVFELTLVQPVDYGGQANFFDIEVGAVFTAPVSGATSTVGGFYYETLADGSSLWKVRFAPSEAGTWTYDYTFTHTPTGDQAPGSGKFDCVPSTAPDFLEQNPANPFRWRFESGEPFVPIGFNSCVSTNDTMQIDGGDRYGAFDGSARTDQYLTAYGGAGFNMFRFSQANCSPNLADASLTTYDKYVAAHFDRLMQMLGAHDFRIFYGLFGYLLPNDPTTPPTPEVFQFVDYSINRWGAYVDIWQLQNERSASDAWISTVATYLRTRDPYAHPITTSWQRPDLAEIEINAPHWYQYEDELLSDHETASRADNWKSYGKPVIVGEQGNSTPEGEETANWLPDSARRMRLRTWTAFFKEISLLFWNNTWATNGMSGPASNIYLGPEERRYIHVLQLFSNFVIRSDTQVWDVDVSDDSLLRAYGLRSSDGAAVYVHHYADHVNTVSGETIGINIPQAGQGYWIDPISGRNLGTVAVSAGFNVVTIPDFIIDVAFFSTAASPLDAPPIAIVEIENPQADGDLDDDGLVDHGPADFPFGIAPLTLILDATASYDLDGGALSYLWHFGDGSPDEEGPVAVHSYADGNYLTTLTVTDDEGNSGRHGFAVRVTGDPNPDTNDAPWLNRLRDITVREGELVLITPYAADRELEGAGYVADDLTYSAASLPAGATFGLHGANWTEQFWWVPDFSQSGTHVVEFYVQDDSGASAAPRVVTITVLDASGSPGDIDSDGDVDLADFVTFAGCYAGAGVTTPPGGCDPTDFANADLDEDSDVDLADFITFAGNFTG